MFGFASSTQLIAGLALMLLLSSSSLAFSNKTLHVQDRLLIPGTEDGGFKWSIIKPSKELKWVPCYGSLRCARLIVPMDYYNQDNSQTVVLAVVKQPATDMENYLGPMFFQPGGPGPHIADSFVKTPTRQSRVGTNYDIITWDLRGSSGASKTTPKMSCWANNHRRALWRLALSPFSFGGEFDDPRGLRYFIAERKMENTNCRDMMGPTGLLDNISTEHHARDMNAILEAMGDEKMRYWGAGYGSAIGMYYASIFTHKVERMVSESNFDVRKRVPSSWTASVLDAPKVLDFVYETCAADERCALHEKTAGRVKLRLKSIFKKLEQQPQQYSEGHPGSVPKMYTRTDAGRKLLDGLKTPQRLPETLQFLADIERNALNPMTEVQALTNNSFAYELVDMEPSDPHNPDYTVMNPLETEELVQCGEARPLDYDDPDLVHEIRREAKRVSSIFGAASFSSHLRCAGAKQPSERFTGFTGLFGGQTSHPILFLNSWDPIAPVDAAIRNAELFPGSRVALLDFIGHAGTTTSTCMNTILLAYMQDGTLPEEDAICSDLKMSYDPDYEWPKAPRRELKQAKDARRLARRGPRKEEPWGGPRWHNAPQHQPYHERHIKDDAAQGLWLASPKKRLRYKTGVGRFAGGGLENSWSISQHMRPGDRWNGDGDDTLP